MPFKTFPVRPMTGVMDTLSSPDEIGFGGWRLVKNSTTRSTRNRQRGGGWRRLFADDQSFNNQDLHDQLTDRLSYYDSFPGHAMGGGGLSGYSYPYFFPSGVIPEFDVFSTPAGPYCGIYYPSYDGVYGGCSTVYEFVGFPYVNVPASVNTAFLFAHWKLDEIVAGQYQDIITGLHLTAFGAPPEAGILGNAAAFHVGDDDVLQRNTSVIFEMGAEVKFAFTGWLNRFSNGVAQEAVFGKWGTATEREYRLILTNGQLRFEVSNDGTAFVGVTNPATIPSGTWTFFAVWHDSVANTINIKVNDGTTASASHTTGVYALSGSSFTLGRDYVTAVGTLDAKVDSLSLFKNSFPTEPELATLYHSGMALDHPFSLPGCNTGAPDFFLQSFVYVSCPTHFEQEIVPGYGYGPQFPIYSSQFAYDYTYCGTALYSRLGCREAVTMLGEIVTSTGRKLIAGTMSRVYEYNQSAGNWRILADGLGNSGYTPAQCGCNSVRGSMATMGLYLLYTNNFDRPMIYVLGEDLAANNCGQQALLPISDLVALDITRAGGVVVWKGFAIFFDITEGGGRQGGTFIWSDLEQPDSYIESDTSHAGRTTIAVGQTILRMEPLGNWLVCYTDKSIYRITLVGGEDVFNVEEIKGVGGNALKYKYSLINTGSAHVYAAESDVMVFSQFDVQPNHVAWITKAAGMMFNGIHEDDAEYGSINEEACNLVTGGWNEDKREAWLSWPTGDNVCPDVTLRFNIKFNTADLVDHGFTSFLTFRADFRPTVGQWMEDMGICARATLVAQGPKDGQPCSEAQEPVVNPPLYIRNPEEDPDLPVHADSLCARLVGLSRDDFCEDCAAPATFISASAEDLTLKQQEDDYYFREMLGGGPGDYDTYSCTGQYYEYRGYDTVFQTGAMDLRSDNEKMLKRVTIEAFPEPQSTPSLLRCWVGYASQANCPTWRESRFKDYECQTAMTAAEHAAARTRPDDRFHFPFWARGKYLYGRFAIQGIGGAGEFSEVNFTIQEWEANTSR